MFPSDSGPTTSFPKPGGFVVEGDEDPSKSPREEDEGEEPDLDPRVRWSDSTFGRLKSAREEVTSEMKRNRDLYNAKHWSVFGTGKRPGWKLGAVVNYCHWVVDRKAAVLTDNKPKVTYSANNRSEDWQAEIMSAAFDEFYDEENVQEKLEDLVKLAEIDKVAWLRLTYDPLRRGGKGGARLDVLPGMSVYANKEAKDVSADSPTHLCYEYTLPRGEVLTRWKHLRGKALTKVEAGENREPGTERPQPATSFDAGDGSAVAHNAPYDAPTSDSEPAYGERILIREWWTRPYGPKYETTVKAMQFTAGGQLVTRRKMFEFKNEKGEVTRVEPLQTVVTEGNIVYELPMSAAMMLEWCETLGGLKIIKVKDAYEVVRKPKLVPLYPTGRRMIVAGRQVADDGANPFAHGGWPFIPCRSNRDGLTLYPKCNIDLIATMQDALNRIVGMVFDAANLMANPIWRLPLNAEVDDGALTNAPGAIIREDIPSLRFGKREAGVEIPTFVMQYITFLIDRILQITNTTDIGSGQGKTKGQQSAETVNMYQEAAGVGNRPAMRELERAVVTLGNQFRGIVAQFYTDQRVARIERATGGDHQVKYIGTHLSAEMKMRAKAGSGLPQSPSARLQIVQQLMSTPAMDIPELLRNLEEVGVIESASAHLKRLMQEKNDPQRQWLIPALMGPPPGGRKKNAKPNAGKSARANGPLNVSMRG